MYGTKTVSKEKIKRGMIKVVIFLVLVCVFASNSSSVYNDFWKWECF